MLIALWEVVDTRKRFWIEEVGSSDWIRFCCTLTFICFHFGLKCTILLRIQDPDAILEASNKLSKYIESGQLEVIQTNFRYIKDAVKEKSKLSANNGGFVDGVLMDLGISSHQIDEPTRGFSYRYEILVLAYI